MQNRFHRSTTDRRFGGVCAGLAETFGLDITLVRIAAFFLCVRYPSAVILYFVLALTMPLVSDAEAGAEPSGSIPSFIDSISLWRTAVICAVCTCAGWLIYTQLFGLTAGVRELVCFALLAIGLSVLVEGILTDPSDGTGRMAKITVGALCAFICLMSLASEDKGFSAFSFGYITSSLTYLWPALLGLAAVTLIMPKKKIAAGLLWAAIIAVIILSLIRALGVLL